MGQRALSAHHTTCCNDCFTVSCAQGPKGKSASAAALMSQLTADPDSAAALLRGLSSNPTALQAMLASMQHQQQQQQQQ